MTKPQSFERTARALLREARDPNYDEAALALAELLYFHAGDERLPGLIEKSAHLTFRQAAHGARKRQQDFRESLHTLEQPLFFLENLFRRTRTLLYFTPQLYSPHGRMTLPPIVPRPEGAAAEDALAATWNGYADRIESSVPTVSSREKGPKDKMAELQARIWQSNAEHTISRHSEKFIEFDGTHFGRVMVRRYEQMLDRLPDDEAVQKVARLAHHCFDERERQYVYGTVPPALVEVWRKLMMRFDSPAERKEMLVFLLPQAMQPMFEVARTPLKKTRGAELE